MTKEKENQQFSTSEKTSEFNVYLLEKHTKKEEVL
jgi:hypothetical protein